MTFAWRSLAFVFWTLALAGASIGYAAGRVVYERGAAVGDAGSALPDLDGPQRAINTQLEVEPDAAAQRRSLRMIQEAGFGWIRQQFDWSQIEVGGKGQFFDHDRRRPTWDKYDVIVDAALEQGIKIIARIELPPEWSRPAGSSKTHPPTNVQDYADFVASFVGHYRGRIGHVQLWNEPNLNAEWGDQRVDPTAYVELLRAGYRGAKRGDSNVRVISAALAQTLEPDAPAARGLDDLLYLEEMYAAGAKPFFDILGANAYGLRTGPEDRQVGSRYTNFPRVLLAREVMRRHHDAGKAVWISEFGWNALPADWSGLPSPWGQVSQARQAANVQGAFLRARQEWPWMGPMSLWLFRQPRPNPKDPTQYFGLVDDQWRARPAYDALRASAASAESLGPGVHQETSSGLAFQGTWQQTVDPTASLGALRESPISGAALRFRFHGTSLDLVAPVGPTRGIAYIKVNGAYTLANRLPLNRNGQATVDFYSPAIQAQRRIRVVDGLPDREHALELVVTGEHNDASGGPGVGIDAVAVARARPVLPSVILGTGWLATGLALVWWLRPSLVDRLPALRMRRSRRMAVLAVAAILPLSPLALRTPAGRFSPVELLVLVCLALDGLALFIDGRLGGWRGAYRVPALILLLAGGVSLLVADYPRLALRELRTLVVEPALFYFVARSALRGALDGRRLAYAFIGGATGAGLLALGQVVGRHNLVPAEGVARAAGLYPSPNNLGLLLDRALPLALALLAGQLAAGRRPRLLAGAVAVLAIALFFTFSRGAWLSVAVAAGFAVRPVWRRVALPRRRTLWLTAASALPLLAAALTIASQVERFRSVTGAQGTAFLRVHLWLSSLAMLRDHLLLGVGLDQFLYHYPRYLHEVAAREPNLSHPHNIVLDFWLRLGVLGVLALVFAAYQFWLRVAPASPAVPGRRRAAGTTGEAGPDIVLATGVLAAGIGLLIHGLVDNSYFVLDLAYATWIVLLLSELAHQPDAASQIERV